MGTVADAKKTGDPRGSPRRRRRPPRVWLVSAAAAVMAFATLGFSRSVGVLFVEVATTYGVSREQASWPFALQGCTLASAGILPGLLEAFLSTRHQLYLGTSLIVLGLGLCYLVSAFEWLVFSYGIIYGVGYSVLLPTTVVALNREAKQHRATANGIMWSGDSMALFAMPPLYSLLLEAYGLRGTLLIASGIFLNLYFCSYYLTRNDKKAPKICDQKDSISIATVKDPATYLSVEQTKEDKKGCGELAQSKGRRFLLVLKRAWDLLRHPLFAVVTMVHLFYSFCCFLYCMVLFDHALNIGVSRSSAVFLTTVFAMAEFAGRIGGGWVSDSGLLERRTMVIIGEIVGSLLFLCHGFFTHAGILFAMSATLGVLSGVCLTMSNVLYVELLGFENLALCLGLKNTILGVISFLRSILIGYSKDSYGSYNALMFVLSGMAMVFGLSWFLQPILTRPKTDPPEQTKC